jgi:hypothetical protein
MHDTIAIAQKLLSTARALNQLVTHINSELTMAELVILSDLNEEFVTQTRDIDIQTRAIADNLHRYVIERGLLEKGFDMRSRADRRTSTRDRRA